MRVHLDIFIQVKNMVGDWETEILFFPSLTTAIEYGRQHFNQNEWRVMGHTPGRDDVLYETAPDLVTEALADARRFENTARYRELFALQAVHEQQAEERRRTMFVNIARSAQTFYTPPFAAHYVGWEEDDDEDGEPKEAVNWKEEGF